MLLSEYVKSEMRFTCHPSLLKIDAYNHLMRVLNSDKSESEKCAQAYEIIRGSLPRQEQLRPRYSYVLGLLKPDIWPMIKKVLIP